jgi:hypothetical protein
VTRRTERALVLSFGIALGWLVSAVARALAWEYFGTTYEVQVEIPRPPVCAEAPRLPIT